MLLKINVGSPLPDDLNIAFIGGGNMACSIIGGLLRQGLNAQKFCVIEPASAAQNKLLADFNIQAHADAITPKSQAHLQKCPLLIWAIKPQLFQEAAAPIAPLVASNAQQLHLSVAAGITTASIAAWVQSTRIVRAMPNTPALIGQGITGLFATPSVTTQDRLLIETIIRVTGKHLWLDHESQLDAVTAISGSGPAYVFYFLEAMLQAAQEMGLSHEQAQNLALQTFAGSTALAAQSNEPPEILRQRVTSKGGTTHAAFTHLENAQVKPAFIAAMHAAKQRAQEMGQQKPPMQPTAAPRATA